MHDHPILPDDNESPCHYRRALELVSTKWTVLVFYELGSLPSLV
ncbi:hypothetical protein [Cohnella cholangitidis]|nr:hypothetical protein [Cohnella cholangitidis]